MKTIEEVLNFCNEVLFYDHYNLQRVIEISHVRDCVTSILIYCGFISEYEVIRALDVIDNISLMVIDEKVLKKAEEKKQLESCFTTTIMFR